MPPSVVLSPTGRVALVTPRGEVDVANVGELRTALLGAVRTPVTLVVLDLVHVTFLDSSALGAVVEAHRALVPPRHLLVANVAGLPLRTLQITGLDTVLDLVRPEEPLEAALDALLL